MLAKQLQTENQGQNTKINAKNVVKLVLQDKQIYIIKSIKLTLIIKSTILK